MKNPYPLRELDKWDVFAISCLIFIGGVLVIASIYALYDVWMNGIRLVWK